ncbi:MAG: hypothetical protein JWM53_3885, partial [bacterium]|nr:hypothetical protein [bacterium]
AMMIRSTLTLIQTALVSIALSSFARAATPTANGVNASVGNSSPTAAMQGWAHHGNPKSRSVPTFNGVNANVGNSSRAATIEHSPHKLPPSRP